LIASTEKYNKAAADQALRRVFLQPR